MSKRNLFIAALILVALAFIGQFVKRSDTKQADERIGQPLLSKNLVESFNEIILQDSKSIVHLQKKETKWIVLEKDGLPANMKNMLELVDKLTRFNISSFITKDKSRLAYFKLVYRDEDGAGDENSGAQLTLNDSGKTIFRLVSGKQRQSKAASEGVPSYPDGSYVRIGDSQSVYLIKDNLNLETNPDEWVEKSLFKLDKKEVKSLQFEILNHQFKFEREDKGKELELANLGEKEKTKDYERTSLLGELEDFKVDEIVKKTTQLEHSLELKSVITITPFDVAPLTFEVYAKLEGEKPGSNGTKEKEYSYYVKFVKPSETAGNTLWNTVSELSENWLFKVEEWKARRWMKERKDFVEDKKE